jgi:hypothetical protein
MNFVRARRPLLMVATTVTAIALAFSGSTAAIAATPHPAKRVVHEIPVAGYLWVVTSVGAAHTTYGSWRTCVTLTPRSTTSTATCTAGGSVANTVTGTIGIGYEGISESVGFSVTKTYTVSGSQSFTIPAHAGGKLQWRPVYSTKTVHQSEYYYSVTGARSTVATATNEASKYTSPTFRYEP